MSPPTSSPAPSPASTPDSPASPSRAWTWIPPLYFMQGLPNVAVATLAVVMYKNLGVSNADIALYTSWLYLPWVIKPLWSPLLEFAGRKRTWIVATQFVVGGALALVALTVPAPDFFRLTLALFWLLAFSSATHDIAADGFYLLAQPPHQQAAFVGVRSTFFRLAMIAGQGGLVWLAGHWQKAHGSFPLAWRNVFALTAAAFVVGALYNAFVLPRPAADRSAVRPPRFLAAFFAVFAEFFRKPRILATLAFLLLYRFPEAQLVKMITPFLLDAREKGGLGISTEQVGTTYGFVGTASLLAGGLLGGWLISRAGLKRMLWPLVLAMHVPNFAYVFLALQQPTELALINAAVGIEQFGYGLGFTAYMVFMMRVAEGEHKTAHYALCTGFMALGMMLPGMLSGYLQQTFGYTNFFLWVCAAAVLSLVATSLVRIAPEPPKAAGV